MSQYFAVALARVSRGWTGRELDLDDVKDFDDVADLLRDFAEAESADGPVLLLVEEDDEYVGIVRGHGDRDPQVFLSDRRVVAGSDIAAVLFEHLAPSVDGDDDVPTTSDEEDEESQRPVAEPGGDAALLSDLGTPSDPLLRLCAEEGMLPADVISALCERAGCLDVLERIREG